MNCLNKEELNIYLSGEELETKRDPIEMHLADCFNCRLNLTDLYAKDQEEFFPAPKHLKKRAKRLPKKEKKAKPFFSFLLTRQSALASFIVLFSVIGFWVWNSGQNQTSNGTDILRQGQQNSNAPILLSPVNNATLSGKKINFKWKNSAEVNSYVLIVSDEKGDIVFEKKTKEENLIIKNSEADLISGNHYFWYVRAKFIDGNITETSPRKFTFKN